VADRFYSVPLGAHTFEKVTEGASTSSEAVELRVNDSIYARKLDVLNGLDAIKQFLQSTSETSPIE
jgi:hypothetical protein